MLPPIYIPMTTHSSILAWRIPTDIGAWRATPHGLQRVGTKHSTSMYENSNCSTSIYLFTYFYFQPHCAASGTLVPWPGIKPMPSTLGGQSPNHWTNSKVPYSTSLSTFDNVKLSNFSHLNRYIVVSHGLIYF